MDLQAAQRAQARAAVMIGATIIGDGALKTLDDVVAALEEAHYDTLTAERLTLLVPLAFGRVELKAKGIAQFPWTARIDTSDGKVLELDLQADPLFLEALRYAVESYEGDGLDEGTASRLAANSPEVGAARAAEEAGQAIRGARLHEAVWASRLSAQAWQGVAT